MPGEPDRTAAVLIEEIRRCFGFGLLSQNADLTFAHCLRPHIVRRHSPAFAALLVVVVGGLLGEWAGLLLWLGNAWFWFGNQGSNTSRSAASGKYCSHLPRLLVRLVVASRGVGLARSGAAQSHHFLLDRRRGDPGILP